MLLVMSRLLLFRHGKAGGSWHDYDHLSERGAQQAAHAARRLLREETELVAAYHGNMRRQRETAEVVRRVFEEAKRPFPPLRELPGLDEMAHDVIDAALVEVAEPALREHVTAWITGRERSTRETRAFMMDAFSRFARGELRGDFEDFQTFRVRVLATLGAMLDEGRGTVVAFTSGGFIATAAGFALETPLDPTVRLMATMENASLTELRHSRTRDRFSVVRLNDIGHLPPGERTLL